MRTITFVGLLAVVLSVWACQDLSESNDGESGIDLLEDGADLAALDSQGASDTPSALLCATGLSACDGVCLSLARDPANCGACGRACRSGELCIDNACTPQCPPGFVLCGGACVDPQKDRAYCGANEPCELEPGEACQAGEVCVDGSCALICQEGLVICNEVCVDTSNDRAHCGGCDDGSGAMRCSAGEICVAGSCVLTCQEGLTSCGDECVDLSTDNRYCSATPGVCGEGCEKDELCQEGVCILTCTGATLECGGACTDILLDPNNCGGCGDQPAAGDHICEQTDDTYGYCRTGVCHQGDCPTGWANCDRDPANVCEVDLSTSGGSCGG